MCCGVSLLTNAVEKAETHACIISYVTHILFQALHKSSDPQKLRHLIVAVFHHQHSLYETMERIHSHYTKQHVRHHPQAAPMLRPSRTKVKCNDL